MTQRELRKSIDSRNCRGGCCVKGSRTTLTRGFENALMFVERSSETHSQKNFSERLAGGKDIATRKPPFAILSQLGGIEPLSVVSVEVTPLHHSASLYQSGRLDMQLDAAARAFWRHTPVATYSVHASARSSACAITALF